MKISNLLIWPSAACAYAIADNSSLAERDADSVDTAAEWVSAVSSVVSAGTSVILASSAGVVLYKTLSNILKNDSQKDHCGMSYYSKSESGVLTHSEVYISSTGPNCDTTAEVKTLLNAIDGCVDDLHRKNASAGCCSFQHGSGTWRGHLKLATYASELQHIFCPAI